jgi:hypothetical protein
MDPQPQLETGQLLFLRHVQKELHNHDPFVDEQFLEVVDLLIAGPPDAPRRQLVNPPNQNVLIVGAVEDRHFSFGGRVRMHTPEEIMGEFGCRGLLERGDTAADGIHAGKDVADYPIFSSRIKSLKDNEE